MYRGTVLCAKECLHSILLYQVFISNIANRRQQDILCYMSPTICSTHISPCVIISKAVIRCPHICTYARTDAHARTHRHRCTQCAWHAKTVTHLCFACFNISLNRWSSSLSPTHVVEHWTSLCRLTVCWENNNKKHLQRYESCENQTICEAQHWKQWGTPVFPPTNTKEMERHDFN